MKSSIWFKTGLVLTATGMIVTLSCSRKPENPAWFQSTTTEKSLDTSALLEQIEQTDDIFAIYRMRQEYRSREDGSQAIKNALEEQWKKLLRENSPPGEICPEANLIAFDFKAIGPGEYRTDFIFRINRAFDKNYWVSLHGTVDGENFSFLPENRRKSGRDSEQWDFQPHPPTTAWPAGEDILISHVFSAQPIPYKMSAFLYDRSVKSGLHGQPVQMGWRSGITEYSLLSLIKSCDDLIRLFKLKTEYHTLVKQSDLIRKGFEKKSKELLKGKKPLGPICPEADLIAFDYKKVGTDQYQIDYLFKVKQSFDKDYYISLYGIVDKSNLSRLSEKRRKAGKKSEVWPFQPEPTTSRWPAGEYVLVSNLIHAQPIPYKMNTLLYDPNKKIGLHGQPVHLGWMVDLGE